MPTIEGMPFKVDDTLPSDRVWMFNTGRGMGKTAAMAKAFGMGQKKLNELIFGNGKAN